jgi:hypothetical protein
VKLSEAYCDERALISRHLLVAYGITWSAELVGAAKRLLVEDLGAEFVLLVLLVPLGPPGSAGSATVGRLPLGQERIGADRGGRIAKSLVARFIRPADQEIGRHWALALDLNLAPRFEVVPATQPPVRLL